MIGLCGGAGAGVVEGGGKGGEGDALWANDVIWEDTAQAEVVEVGYDVQLGWGEQEGCGIYLELCCN